MLHQLFRELNNEAIRYCLWKSNEHLNEAFEFNTDFDLLIDKKDIDRVHELLKNHGMKRRYSTADKVYPGFEDFVGFDKSSGNLYHFHIHYKIIIGGKLKKNYRISFEEEILNSAIMHDSYPVKVIRPEFELLLLMLRSILKIQINKNICKRSFTGKTVIPPNIIKEFDYLLNRIDREEFTRIAYLCYRDVGFFKEYLKQIDARNYHLSLFRIYLFKKTIHLILKDTICFGKHELRVEKKITKLASRASRSWFSNGGVMVAFIGVDGSGKTTTTTDLANWLSWKLSATRFYLGKPRISQGLRLLDMFSSTLRSLHILRRLIKHISELKTVLLAHIRLKIYQEAYRYSNQGGIAIIDRFPLKEFWDMTDPMDGPRLKQDTPLGRLERKYYKQIRPPDIIFLLDVSEEVSLSRKQEHQEEVHKNWIHEKIVSIEKLRKMNMPNIEVINANNERGEMMLDIKFRLWQLI